MDKDFKPSDDIFSAEIKREVQQIKHDMAKDPEIATVALAMELVTLRGIVERIEKQVGGRK